jgi:hypothetical protein
MYYFTSGLHELNIHATDGEMGKIKDLYIEGTNWNIRYIVVDTRKWLPERKVLLPPHVFQGVNEEEGTMEVEYDKQEIKNSPPVPEEENLTKDKEDQLINYFGWSWPDKALISGEQRPIGVFRGVDQQKRQEAYPTENLEEEELLLKHRDNNLRSHEEIIGAPVHGTNGKLGRLVDFVYDDNWNITSIVITSNEPTRKDYYPYLIEQINSVDWFENDIYLNESVEDFRMKDAVQKKSDILHVQ